MKLTKIYDIDEILSRDSLPIEKQVQAPYTIYRTVKTTALDPYVFYIQCVAGSTSSEDMKEFIDKETEAKHISEEQFFAFVQKELGVETPFVLKGDFVDAIELDNAKDLLCETTEELLFFKSDVGSK